MTVRERLLREPNLTLAKTDQICRAAESMTVQMKEIVDESTAAVHMVKEPETIKTKARQQAAHENAGTVVGSMNTTRETCVQHMARSAKDATSSTTLQVNVEP